MGTTRVGGKYGQDVYVLNQAESTTMEPVDIQSSYAKAIQTNSSKPSNYSPSNWIDTEGYTKVAFNVAVTEGAHLFTVQIQWSNDGANIHGREEFAVTTAAQYFSRLIDTKLRYFRVYLYNNDATARTMVAHAYLKAV